MPISKVRQFKINQQIARASSLEEFTSSSQFRLSRKSKGTKHAIESFNDAPDCASAMVIDITSFIAREIALLISRLSIFFSSDPQEVFKEFKELLLTPELADTVIKELSFLQSKRQQGLDTVFKIFEQGEFTPEQQEEYNDYRKVEEAGAQAKSAQWEAAEAIKQFNRSRQHFAECYPDHSLSSLDEYSEFMKENI